MGKIKHKRNALHFSAPKPIEAEYTVPDYKLPEDKKEAFNLDFEKREISKSNIFQNVSIPKVFQKQTNFLSKADLRNAELTDTIRLCSSVKNFNMSSPYFRRKIAFGDVVRSARMFQACVKAEKRRKAAAILGDFQAVKDALPTLEELVKESDVIPPGGVRCQVWYQSKDCFNQRLFQCESKGKIDDRPRASKPSSRQNVEMMEDIQAYHQTLNSLQQVSDPVAAISAQLKEKFTSGYL